MSMRDARFLVEVHTIAKGIVERARLAHSHGVTPEAALTQGYQGAVRKIPKRQEAAQMVALRLAQTTNLLMKYGVLNQRSDSEIAAAGLRASDFLSAPERVIAFCGVNDLYVWPPPSSE